MNIKIHKISFCIVCMNRLHHLEQTLLINILDNQDYPDLEFVLLDYNSSDELEKYVQTTLKEYIENGRLVYYKTPAPTYFNRSHSRNLAFKLASGDLICNIDADNYTGKNFASYLNEQFNKHENIFLTTIGQGFKIDVLGRICVRKVDFYKIRGYDEKMINYGFEDYDFANRLEIIGIKRQLFQKSDPFFNAIAHEQEQRLSNEFVSKNLAYILVNYLTPECTDMVFLFSNKEFKRFIHVDHQTFIYPEPSTVLQQSQLEYRNSFIEAPFTQGTWEEYEQEIILRHPQEFKLSFDRHKNSYANRNTDFYKVTDAFIIEELVMLYSQILNRLLMAENKLKGHFAVNQLAFGQDKVYKNFNSQVFLSV